MRFAGHHPISLSSNLYSDRRIHLVVVEPRLLSLNPYCYDRTRIAVDKLISLSSNPHVLCEGVKPVSVLSTGRGVLVSRRRSVKNGGSP